MEQSRMAPPTPDECVRTVALPPSVGVIEPEGDEPRMSYRSDGSTLRDKKS